MGDLNNVALVSRELDRNGGETGGANGLVDVGSAALHLEVIASEEHEVAVGVEQEVVALQGLDVRVPGGGGDRHLVRSGLLLRLLVVLSGRLLGLLRPRHGTMALEERLVSVKSLIAVTVHTSVLACYPLVTALFSRSLLLAEARGTGLANLDSLFGSFLEPLGSLLALCLLVLLLLLDISLLLCLGLGGQIMGALKGGMRTKGKVVSLLEGHLVRGQLLGLGTTSLRLGESSLGALQKSKATLRQNAGAALCVDASPRQEVDRAMLALSGLSQELQAVLRHRLGDPDGLPVHLQRLVGGGDMRGSLLASGGLSSGEHAVASVHGGLRGTDSAMKIGRVGLGLLPSVIGAMEVLLPLGHCLLPCLLAASLALMCKLSPAFGEFVELLTNLLHCGKCVVTCELEVLTRFALGLEHHLVLLGGTRLPDGEALLHPLHTIPEDDVVPVNDDAALDSVGTASFDVLLAVQTNRLHHRREFGRCCSVALGSVFELLGSFCVSLLLGRLGLGEVLVVTADVQGQALASLAVLLEPFVASITVSRVKFANVL
mmetsp:Transcript_75508/g.177285  ORF Transcript_75508/g.177285 Transcript_75508/m.177285 type:complete len:545 (+) Transcript_75508:691-2325(+)